MEDVVFNLMFLGMDSTGRCELFCDEPITWGYLSRSNGHASLLRKFQVAADGQDYEITVTVYETKSPVVTEKRRLVRGKGPVFTENDRFILNKVCEACRLEILEYRASRERVGKGCENSPTNMSRLAHLTR